MMTRHLGTFVVILLTATARSTRVNDYLSRGAPPWAGSTYGEACAAETPRCLGGMACFKTDADGKPTTPEAGNAEGVCACAVDPGMGKINYYPDLFDFTCLGVGSEDVFNPSQLQTEAHGALCYATVGAPPKACKVPFYCNHAAGMKCTCPKGTPMWDPDVDGGKCTGKRPSEGNCVPADKDCAAPFVCTADGTCQCPSGRQWDGHDKCFVKAGEDCKGGGETCLPDKGLHCSSDGKCSCAEADFVWVEEGCKSKGDQLACDPDAEVNTCAENEVKNLECDKVSKMCVCPSDSVHSETANACKLKGGEPCTVKGTVEHGLCHSQFCGLDGKCDCKDGDKGQRRIWASEPPGCVDDKSGLACTKDEDCQFPNLKRGKEGLTCKENHCVCKPGYSYQFGYCFEDKDAKGHDMDCDPKGVESVCNVKDTGLACRREGTAHNCMCLPKDVMRGAGAENEKYVSMEWDAAQGRCALKAEGVACADKDECRGKVCDKGKCVGDGKAKRGGAKAVASAYAEVMLMTTFALVLRQF